MREICKTQGTQEWLDARLAVTTASNMYRALSVYKVDRKPNKKGDPSAVQLKYVREIATEIMTGVPVEHFVTPSMDRGIANEPLARKHYAEAMGLELRQTGFVLHPTENHIGASPDSLVGEDGCLEIKCPEPTTHADYLLLDSLTEDSELDKISDYFWQVHTEILCCEREWCDFVSYSPLMKNPALRMKRIRVYRNEEIIKRIEDGALAFWERVVERLQKTFGGVEDDPTMRIPALPSSVAPARPSVPQIDLNERLRASVKREEEKLGEIDDDWDEIIEKPLVNKGLRFPARSGNWEKIF